MSYISKISLSIIFASMLMLCSCTKNYPKKSFKKGELMYNPIFTSEQVIAAGNFFIDEQYFTNENKTSIVLEKSNDTVILRIVVDKASLVDTTYDSNFREIAKKAQEEIFSENITISELIDPTLSLTRRIK